MVENNIVDFLKETAPHFLFYAILAIVVGLYLKHLSKQIVGNFKTIITESRKHYTTFLAESRNSKEEILKDLNYYKKQLEEYREDNAEIKKELEQLKSRVTELESLIDNIQLTMQKQYNKFEEGLNEFKDHSNALFEERDKLLKDIDLAWKAIYRQTFGNVPKTKTEDIEKFKSSVEDKTG